MSVAENKQKIAVLMAQREALERQIANIDEAVSSLQFVIDREELVAAEKVLQEEMATHQQKQKAQLEASILDLKEQFAVLRTQTDMLVTEFPYEITEEFMTQKDAFYASIAVLCHKDNPSEWCEQMIAVGKEIIVKFNSIFQSARSVCIVVKDICGEDRYHEMEALWEEMSIVSIVADRHTNEFINKVKVHADSLKHISPEVMRSFRDKYPLN
jgi:hypothetical protein